MSPGLSCEDGFSIREMYWKLFGEVHPGASSGCAGLREAQPLGLRLGEECSVTASLFFPPLQASQAVETPLPDPQKPKKRRTPQHCPWAPQSLVTRGQGYLLSLMNLHLQAPTVPGETCPMLVCGPQSLPALMPLTLLCPMTPGQQAPSPQKTPGHLPLRWTTDRKRSLTLTHPRKSTDREAPQGI